LLIDEFDLNVARAKQVLQNNLIYGENTRLRNFQTHAHELFDNFMEQGAISNTVYVTPDPSRLLGWDGSHWGGVVDLTNTYERGMRFSIFKCVDGTVPTNYWDVNLPNAISKGFATGSYAWLYPDRYVNAKLQARAYWNRLKTFPIQLPPSVDFEWTMFAGNVANPDWNDMWIYLNEFLLVSGGLKPMIYTAKGYTDKWGVVPASIRDLVAGWWIASYGGTRPLLPQGITQETIWQFSPELEQAYYCPSSTGKKELDGNYFWSNDYTIFYSFANMTPVVDPPPVDPPPVDPPIGGNMKIYKGTVKETATPYVILRDMNGVDVGRINPKDGFEASGELVLIRSYWRFKLTSINGVPVTTDKYLAETFCTYTTTIVTDPTIPPPVETLPDSVWLSLTADGARTEYRKVV